MLRAGGAAGDPLPDATTGGLTSGSAPPAGVAEGPNMRSLAAWYWASLSASDFCCCESGDGAPDGPGVVFEGRFRMRMDGWSAAGGGCVADDAVAVGAIIS